LFARSSTVRDLEERVHKAERELASLRLEWEDVQTKIVRRMRAMRQAAEYLKERDEEAAAEKPAAAPDAPHSLLTPRQKAIQQQILQRRGGNNS
jgi:chromosome segregation ATPase